MVHCKIDEGWCPEEHKLNDERADEFDHRWWILDAYGRPCLLERAMYRREIHHLIVARNFYAAKRPGEEDWYVTNSKFAARRVIYSFPRI